MKPETRVLNVDSNLTGEKVGMTIDEGALAHIMSVLTDLYSDPEMAVIREYSTNARDSHIEAGKADRPIEVTTPTALAPFFKVRDYGVGLDADDIRDIYSRYGASTKRNSDDVVGMLGLGCKSALTYADQFTLSGIKNGVRTEVAVSRDEDGTGSMTLVAQYETDDEDGVEVVVPARSGNQFERKAAEFYRFWDEGTVLVDGKAPTRIDGLWIADDMVLSEDRDLPAVTIVMGGVPYSAEEYRYSYRHGQKLVAFVEIGAVQFTPSRESLQMTAKTKATIDALLKREEVEKEAALKRLVDEAPDAYEAVRILATARRMGLKGEATWQGKVVPLQAERPKDGFMALAECPKAYRQRGYDERMSAPLGTNIIWLVGFDGAKFSPYKRLKLDQWYSKNVERLPEGQRHTFAIVSKLPADVKPWVDPKHVLKWAEVDAEKIVKEKTVGANGQKVSGTYHVFKDGSYRRNEPADQLPDKDLYYYQGPSGWGAGMPAAVKFIINEKPHAVIVPLGGNRIQKFKRDFPHAKEANEYVRKLAERRLKALTDDERLSLAVSNGHVPTIVGDLDAKRIQDEELVGVIAARKKSRDVTRKVESLRKHASYNFKIELPEVPNFHDRYPLLDQISSYGRPNDDIYTYINAKYIVQALETV